MPTITLEVQDSANCFKQLMSRSPWVRESLSKPCFMMNDPRPRGSLEVYCTFGIEDHNIGFTSVVE
jgi:hypothetical protein